MRQAARGIFSFGRLGAAVALLLASQGIWGQAGSRELAVDPQAPGCSDERGDPYCGIQAAVDAAPAGATIRIASAVYDLLGEELQLSRSVRLIGAGAESSILDGGGQHPGPLVRIAASAEAVHLEALTLRNRQRIGGPRMGPGGIEHRAGNLTLIELSLRNLQGGLGGAVRSVIEFGQLDIRDSIFRDNQGFVGGALAVQDGAGGQVRISGTLMEGNTAVFTGGAIFIRDVLESDLSGVTLRRNSCGNRGAGLYLFAETVAMEVAIRDSVIAFNQGRESAGLDLNGPDIEVNLARVALAGNEARTAAKTDCAIEGTGIVYSEGGNLIGIGDDCPFEAGADDRIGNTSSPVSLTEPMAATWPADG